jgi:hypothetical protein
MNFGNRSSRSGKLRLVDAPRFTRRFYRKLQTGNRRANQPQKGIIMKTFIKRLSVVSLGIMVMICALVAYGYSSRRTTPPAEVNLETVEIEINFGDEFIPLGDDLAFNGDE